MKKFNKILSLFLCAVLLFSFTAPSLAFADEVPVSDQYESTSAPLPDPSSAAWTKEPTIVGKYSRKLNAKKDEKLEMSVAISPANNGRTVLLQRYDSQLKDYETILTYQTQPANTVVVNFEFPSKFRKKTTGFWRFIVEETETEQGFVSERIRVTTKNVTTLKLNSKGACIISLDTGEIIYEKNPYKKFMPASSTKLMTALVVLDNASLGRYIKVSPALAKKVEDISTPNLSMRSGDSYKVRDLIYAMILPSCNDAAYLLAAGVFGSQGGCVAAMNKKAKKLHLKNTHFRNTYGYPKNGHYTCAYDMCLMAAAACDNSEYVKICTTYKHKFSTANGRRYTLINGDKLYGYKGHIGGKTGYYVEENKASFTGVYEYKGKRYAVCQMYASAKGVRWKDMRKLYEYVRKYARKKY